MVNSGQSVILVSCAQSEKKKKKREVGVNVGVWDKGWGSRLTGTGTDQTGGRANFSSPLAVPWLFLEKMP